MPFKMEINLTSTKQYSFQANCISQNCQNPNLTTTQPPHNTTQPNLNIGLGLTELLLYTTTTPPPPRNSTSTRKNDPRGLKFVLQHRVAILTTTQHNYNPTIFWGGGGQPHPPSSRVNPTKLVFFTKNLFGQLRTTQQNSNPSFFLGRGGGHQPLPHQG